MIELFRKIFRGKNIPEAELARYAGEFAYLVLLALLGAAESRVNDDDKKLLEESLNTNDLDRAVAMIKGKFSEEEWQKLLDQKIGPLVEEYMDEVVGE